ncbi:MAG: hypothetical protein AB8B64_03205 [Granulosicoccus sp.]
MALRRLTHSHYHGKGPMEIVCWSSCLLRLSVALALSTLSLSLSADYSLRIIDTPAASNPPVDGTSLTLVDEGVTKSGFVAINGFYPDPIDANRAGVWNVQDGSKSIGTLGGFYSVANDINEGGQLVGRSFTHAFRNHAFIWSPGLGIQDLGTLGTHSEAYAINGFGQVVGITDDPDGNSRAFSWTVEDGMTGLDLLGAQSGYAFNVDDDGRVTGLLAYDNNRDVHIFSWRADEGMIDRGSVMGEFSIVQDSTDNGKVVGQTRFADGNYRAFLFTPDGATTDLGTLGGNFSTTRDVSTSGQVVGFSTTDTGGTHAFSWTAVDGLLDLGTLGGDFSVANAVNDAGQVVGGSADVNGEARAFFWSAASGIVDLNSLVPEAAAQGLQLEVAREISETGSIVAYGRVPEQAAQIWVVLTPDNGSGNGDEDADGVADVDDLCPGTVLGVMPTVGVTKRRFYATVDGLFIDGRGTESLITVSAAGGCSGQQIIASAGHSSSNERFGLWERHLISWATDINVNSDPDEDGDGVVNVLDVCPGTVLGITPTIKATKGRFYATADGTFVDGRGSLSDITVASTGGCSGQQIIKQAGLASSNKRYGVWERHLFEWNVFVDGNASTNQMLLKPGF